MTPKGLFLLFGAVLVVLPERIWGQRFSTWPVNSRVYRAVDGLPESACICVTLSPQARVVVRHLKSASISRLDGYTITVIPSPGAGNSRVYESPAGQLWTVVGEGLQEFRNGNWVLHSVPEVTMELRTHVARVIDPVPLCPSRLGVVLFLLPDRLVEFNAEDSDRPRTESLLTAAETRLERFSGMALARDGGLWIAGARGLAKLAGPVRQLKRDSERHDYLLPEALQFGNLQQPQEDAEGVVTAMADSAAGHQKALLHFDGQQWTSQVVPIEKTRHAWQGPDQTSWAATIDSLIGWEPGGAEVTQSEEGSGRQNYDLAVEPSGAFLLATSDGLSRYAPLAWRKPARVRSLNSLVHGLAEDEAGRLWFVSGNRLHLLEHERLREYALPATAADSPAAMRALFPLKNGVLLLAAGEQCFRFDPAGAVWTVVPANPSAGPLRPLGMLTDGRVCFQRSGSATAEPNLHLETYDGTRFEPLSMPTPDPPPGNTLSTVFAAQKGDLWVSGDRGTAWYHDQKWRMFDSTAQSGPESAIGFAQLADGRICCATQDKVWVFDGSNWYVLRAGLDRVNALLVSRDGGLWVATDSGLHRFFQGAWVENDSNEGLPAGSIHELCEDQRGRVWAGTAHGLSLYHPDADPDPPRTYIQVLGEQQKTIPEGGTITLTFSGQDKWKYTSRQRLLFSYQLNGRDWSPFQEERTVSFSDLTAGKNYLQVRAMDRNCNVDPNPARFEFLVVLPWYKEARLVLIMLAGAAVALFFAGLAFNRHRQLVRSYAEVEQKVAQRTRELEVANRQLLHSQKMKALGTLAAGIAHDFNNILSIIKGSAQIIEDNLDQPEKVRTRVDRINTVVEQGAGIVKAMLGFSRDSSEQTGACDLNGVLDDTVKLLGDRFLHEVQVTLEPGAGLPQVVCSKDFVQQVLLNFIFNAAEAMTGRKEIILTTRLLDKLPANLVLTPAPADRYVAASVRDYGCGIPPEHLPRIFEPFFTTKAFSARRGTGLGLSMVYELAKKLGAGITVETAVGQGSTFTLILPVAAASTS